MKLYDAKIRIAGNTQHEVWKHRLTAAEVIFLHTIHGGENVIAELIEIGRAEIDNASLRGHLIARYAKREDSPNRALLMQVFGGPGTPLPTTCSMADFVKRAPAEDVFVTGEIDFSNVVLEPEPVVEPAPVAEAAPKRAKADAAPLADVLG